jgi:hypothetical protein
MRGRRFRQAALGQGFVDELTGRLFDRSKIAARYARFDLGFLVGIQRDCHGLFITTKAMI